MNCLICGAAARFSGMRAVISPWIRELQVTRRRSSKLFECEVCDFSFFDVRYDEKGMRQLYKEYRGLKYTSVREKWESWYSREYNDRHSEFDVLDSRVRAISSFLSQYLDLQKTHLVDVGGDTGDIARMLRPASYEVIEISDRPTSASSGGGALNSQSWRMS
jgi:hypothetical protein